MHISANASYQLSSPELGMGPGTWGSKAAALFRFDALPLHCDSWKAVNKPSSQRRGDKSHPDTERVEERQPHPLCFKLIKYRNIRKYRRLSSKSRSYTVSPVQIYSNWDEKWSASLENSTVTVNELLMSPSRLETAWSSHELRMNDTQPVPIESFGFLTFEIVPRTEESNIQRA